MSKFFLLFAFSAIAGTAMMALLWPLLWFAGVFEPPAVVRKALPGLFVRKADDAAGAPTPTVKLGL
jgi:hypothetical protein